MSFLYKYPPQSLSVAIPPVQFELDGIETSVTQDTSTPANNTALPSLNFIVKDGVQVPVTKSTGNPSNTIAVPVEIVATTGTPINISAGDINIQTTDMGLNFDSMRVGNGNGNYIAANADGSIDVNILGTVPVSGPLTDAQLRATPVPISGTVSTGLSQPLTDAQLRATAIPVDGSGVTQPISGSVSVSNFPATQPVSAVSLPLPTGAAEQATLSAINVKLPASLGQKPSADSLPVVLSSDQSAIPTTQAALTASFQEITNLTISAQTFIAPAGAKWCKVYAPDTNSVNVRIKLGGTATITSGIQLQPGRSEDFNVAGNISVIAESGTDQHINVTFGA